MKILVIRLDGFADVLLATPLLRCLAKQRPSVEIHVLTQNRHTALFKGNPSVHHVHAWEEASEKSLAKEDFNIVVDLQNDHRSRRLAKALKVVSLRAPGRNVLSALLAARFGRRQPHVVERYFEAVSLSGISNDGQGLDFFIGENDRVAPHDIPLSHRAGFLCIAIGASHNTKKLPVQKLKDLCQRINHPLILIGGEEDAATGDAVASVDPIKIYNACGKFSLHESADLLRQSKVVMAYDDGWAQIAAALGKPVVSVWGSTSPLLGTAPYYANDLRQKVSSTADVLEVKGLWCKPCTVRGRDACPLGHFKCMEKMDTEAVAAAADNRLGGRS